LPDVGLVVRSEAVLTDQLTGLAGNEAKSVLVEVRCIGTGAHPFLPGLGEKLGWT
jgi:hypothetical protein